ncbi:jerky protein homolog-like [Ctenocephalides felis]|uniref:jerky protein homolog-like n=1 Tax=Ctenocephalides felis TaxID=7515 RepID=UPI000E6E39A5|nr:jerky protein homolog-like [Ctenocephalides felis]
MMKRKRVVLSMKDKYDIIRRLDEGEPAIKLAIEYGVGKSTISYIRKQKSDIIEFISKIDSADGVKERKTMRLAENKVADEAIYRWIIIEKRSQGEQINGPILCEKAMELNQQYGGPPNFQASTGWLKRFKSRHGIRDLQNEGEKFLTDLKPDDGDSTLLITEDKVIVELVTVKEENENKEDKKGIIPSAEQAYESLDIALRWFEDQAESDQFQISVLKNILDLAASKKNNGSLNIF